VMETIRAWTLLGERAESMWCAKRHFGVRPAETSA